MAHTVDIEQIKRGNGWSPIRRELGVGAFGINAWTQNDGENIIGDHDEERSGHEELYVVIAGSARFTVDGEDLDAATGTVVFVPDPMTKRRAVATADGTTVLAVGGKPGEAYRPLPWEVNVEVIELFGRDEIVEAKAKLSEALERYDDRSALIYNLACAESRLGEIDPAFDHLREALTMRPTLLDLARDDSDLDALRGDPRFTELVGQPVG